jgi:hypothetical protein
MLNDISTQYSVGLFWVQGILGYPGTKFPTGSQGGSCSLVCGNRIGLGGLPAGYKMKDKTLDEQPAYGSVGQCLPVLREKIEY